MIKFWLQCVYVTLFVFGMMIAVGYMSDLKFFSDFDAFSQALKGFEMTDIAFSRIRPDPTVDQRIVLVNIGHITRREMAQQIHTINQFHPKVIGVDGFYDCEGGLRDSVNCPQLLDTLGNLMLSSAIQEAGNVVLVSKLLQKTATANNPEAIDFYDSLEISDPLFDQYSSHAFANFPTDADWQEDVKQCRSFIPRLKVGEKYENAFAVELCRKYDSTKTNKLFARDNYEELVNFRGNAEIVDVRLKTLQNKDLGTTNFKLLCYSIDISDVMTGNFDKSLFKDKIVIMTFLGDYPGDPAWEDKYFTPLNKKVAGRANPDMFGGVIHANIVAMILNEDYIGELADWEKYAIAILLSILTVALFIVIDEKLPVWFDAMSVLIQIFQILLISGLVVYCFASFTFKLDLSIALAVSALIGPCYDIFKSAQHEIENRLEARKKKLSNSLPAEGN